MAYFEQLQIKDKNGNSINPAEEETIENSNSLLSKILATLMSPLGFDRSLNRQRSTAVIESGTITTVSTITSIGPYNGAILMNGTNYTAWATTNRNLIS
ncbi:hypothetical protein b3_0281 [Synechococcus phage B3]|nr:hypothetical protein b3_0281 [Synechococcus phage B3]QGT54887.1 hypothetical protein b23_0274 [Synechococcus phage B23]